jgi:alpha/beta superfamily hydrolase
MFEYEEKVVLLGSSNSLIGIVSCPKAFKKPNQLPAIVFLNAGMLHRVGPSRMYVKIARKVALEGYLALRFDLSGLGDSECLNEKNSFGHRAKNEVRLAIDHLKSSYGVKQVILIGLCSGADVAIKCAADNSDVIAAIGLNGFYVNEVDLDSLRSTIDNQIKMRFYRRQLCDVKSWLRLLAGKSNYHSIKRIIFSRLGKRKGDIQSRPLVSPCSDLLVLISNTCNKDLLLVYSEGSEAVDVYNLTLKQYLDLYESTERLCVKHVNNCDHSFTMVESQKELMDLVLKWLQSRQKRTDVITSH